MAIRSILLVAGLPDGAGLATRLRVREAVLGLLWALDRDWAGKLHDGCDGATAELLRAAVGASTNVQILDVQDPFEVRVDWVVVAGGDPDQMGRFHNAIPVIVEPRRGKAPLCTVVPDSGGLAKTLYGMLGSRPGELWPSGMENSRGYRSVFRGILNGAWPQGGGRP